MTYRRKKKKPYLYRLMRKIKRTFKSWARRNPAKAKKFYVILSLVIIIIVVCATLSVMGKIHKTGRKTSDVNEIKVTHKPDGENKVSSGAAIKPSGKPAATVKPEVRKRVDTRQIYSYLQGPRSWKEKRAWSGYWGNTYMDGGMFGAFGCGLCCMANVYSSVTPSYCKASPVDMYRFAKKNTWYWGGSAIDWPYMVKGMRKAGIHCGVKRKPKRYSAFKRDIETSKCAIVLISSYDSACYWKHTPGHYVTIFAYNKNNDRVFLADSGDPSHNRHWVSLKKIYRSLKKASRFQYIRVTGYNRNQDTFRNRRTRGRWIRPAYMKSEQNTRKN